MFPFTGLSPKKDQIFLQDILGTITNPFTVTCFHLRLMMQDPNELKLRDLCSVFNAVSKGKGSVRKLAAMQKLWTAFLHADMFSCLRLVVPELDQERIYSLKEHSIAKLYIKTLQISAAGTDALKLLNYKDPRFGGSGDFATALYQVLEKRCPSSNFKTVGETNQLLDSLAQAESSSERHHLFFGIVRDYSAREQFWVIRIILKNMKMGVTGDTILQHFHPKALEVFNVSSDLRQVSAFVLSPDSRKWGVQTMRPVRPMLAGRCSSFAQAIDLMLGALLGVEIKFDGERVQIHKQGSSLALFSRSGINVTDRYRYGTALGNALDRIKVNECILDGELVVWNLVDGKMEAFGANRPVALEHNDEEGMKDRQLCVQIFDVLSVDGDSCIELPLSERKKKLAEIIDPSPHLIEIVECWTDCKTAQDLTDKLDWATQNGLEGLIVKNMSSPYHPGQRNPHCWVKLKTDSIQCLSDSLDLVILAGSYARTNRISKFWVGVRDDLLAGKYYPLCKVGTGFSQQDLELIDYKLSDHWRPFKVQEYPHMPGWSPRGELPDVWVPPSQSVVIEVSGFELCKSNPPCGWTLRFPRAVGIRLDRTPEDCMTLREVVQMGTQGGRVHTRPTTPSTIVASVPPKVKEEIVAQSSVLRGWEICVLSGDKHWDKETCEQKALENGATIVQNPLPTTTAVISSLQSLRARNAVNSGKHDVLRVPWLRNSIERGKVEPFRPWYCLGLSEASRTRVWESMDEFGDDFREHEGVRELEEMVENMVKQSEMELEEMFVQFGSDSESIQEIFYSL